MLYFIFTVDGDWKEYFNIKLSNERRLPEESFLLELIQREIEIAARELKGRFIHFIHTSPLVRDFFLEKAFRKKWRDISGHGGDTGLHCHEDEPYKEYYYQDIPRMRSVITERCRRFKKADLNVICYRSGFLGFSNGMISILEDNGIYFDFSCEPGRFLTYGSRVISDWRGAPLHHYRMSYDNYCKSGSSKVWEIPIGTSGNKYLYFEKSSLDDMEKIVLDLSNKSIENNIDIVVSVLTHTYEYESSENISVIREGIVLLKKYGSFINLEELKKIIH